MKRKTPAKPKAEPVKSSKGGVVTLTDKETSRYEGPEQLDVKAELDKKYTGTNTSVRTSKGAVIAEYSTK